MAHSPRSQMHGLRKLILEVHRRSVWQVLLIYIGASWGVLEVADHVVGRFAMPEWVYGGAVILLLVGLPVVLATAFVEEGVDLGSDPSGPGRDGEPEEATRSGSRFLSWRTALFGIVLAFAALGAVAAGWVVRRGDRIDEPRRAATVAVLPFTTAAVQADDADFFADGLHDELLTQLSKIVGLSVISRTSVMQYADERPTIREIGRALGVATVVEGGVQRTADRLRVNVQLIDAETDEHIWAETYDRSLTLENLFDIQAEVAQRIAAELRGELTPNEIETLDQRPTASLDAYELYLQARNFYNRRFQQADALRAAELFEQARILDPAFAQAHAYEALTYIWMNWNFGDVESGALGRAALDRAIETGPDLVETRLARGEYRYRIERDYESALDIFQSSLDRAPGNYELIRAVGHVQRRLGHWDAAVEAYERARGLNPDDVDDALVVGQTYRLMRRPAEALQSFDRGLSIDPGFARLRAERTWALIGLLANPDSAATELAALSEGDRLRARLRTIFHAPFADPAYYERDFEAVLDAHETAGGVLYRAITLWVAGRRDEAAAWGDSLAYSMERSRAEEGRTVSSVATFSVFAGLGHALAGRADRARELGDRGAEMITPEDDAFMGSRLLWTRMLIAVVLGDTDDALDWLDFLVSVPSEAQHGFLKLDPIFDPLRGDPRFEEIVVRAEAAVR